MPTSLPPNADGRVRRVGWSGRFAPRSRALLGIGVLLAAVLVLLWPGPLWPLALAALALGLLLALGVGVALLLAARRDGG